MKDLESCLSVSLLSEQCLPRPTSQVHDGCRAL